LYYLTDQADNLVTILSNAPVTFLQEHKVCQLSKKTFYGNTILLFYSNCNWYSL